MSENRIDLVQNKRQIKDKLTNRIRYQETNNRCQFIARMAQLKGTRQRSKLIIGAYRHLPGTLVLSKKS
ncbi:hypothetical protein CWM47_03785 [Spirosoma pollinicola]|uniref:Uncharacterized protein n=1 Tax=Spirosoma pollinicola TaxID=2057025 RepID=A0A2K8YTV7_9BACT|nr:hypothetical protein CWM47_03785 [Spirosoma pollinicola]